MPNTQGYTPYYTPVRPGLQIPGPMFEDDRNEPDPLIEKPKTDWLSMFMKLAGPAIGLMAGGRKGLAAGTQFSTGYMGEEQKQRDRERAAQDREQAARDRAERKGLQARAESRLEADRATKAEKEAQDKADRERAKKIDDLKAAEVAHNWDDVERLTFELYGTTGSGAAAKDAYERGQKTWETGEALKKAQIRNLDEPNRAGPKLKDNVLQGNRAVKDLKNLTETSEPVFYELLPDGTRREIPLVQPPTPGAGGGVIVGEGQGMRKGLQSPQDFVDARSQIPYITPPTAPPFTAPPPAPPPSPAPPPAAPPPTVPPTQPWATREVRKQLGARDLIYNQPAGAPGAPAKPFNEKAVRAEIAKQPTWSEERVNQAVAETMQARGLTREQAVKRVADSVGIQY
mgnify:FL=1